MEKKFELTDEKIEFYGKILYRIRALKDFEGVKKGELGGFIEKEKNLSQEGNCWVYNDAKIRDNAKVWGNAKICGNAWVHGNAEVYNNAEVYDNAKVYNNAEVYDNARVYDNAEVYGNAEVHGNAVVKEEQLIKVGNCTVDLSKNLKENIRCQINLFPQEDYVIAYKQVRKDLTSFYDNKFQYKIGEWVEAKNPDISTTESCAGGLHFSNVNYWDPCVDSTTYLMAKIMYDDIIAIQNGKIRCKKAFIIDKYDIEE